MVRYAFDLYPRTDPRDGAVVRRFEHLLEASYRAEENGTGSGQIKVAGDSADGEDIDPRGLQYVRVLEIDDSDVETVRGGFWLEQGKFQALTRKETKHLEFGGAGTLAYLQRAVMWSRTYIHAVFTGQDPIGTTWNLANQSTFYANGNHLGAMLWRVIYEAQHFQSGAYTHRHFDGTTHTGTHADDRTESAIPDVVMTFDQNEDSSGNPWTLTAGTFTAQVGESVLSVVRRLMEMGLKVEMDPDTFELNAWEAPHRTDRTSATWASGKVLFQAPTAEDIDTGNILSDTIRTIRAFIQRSIVLAGSDNVYAISEGAADIPWEGGYRIDTEDTGTAEDVAARQRLARADAVDHLKVVMKLGNAPLQGRYRPWVHVNPGDLVTVDTGADQWEFDNTTFPVAALTVELKQGGDWRAIAELGSSFTSLLEPAFQSGGAPSHTHTIPKCVPGYGTIFEAIGPLGAAATADAANYTAQVVTGPRAERVELVLDQGVAAGNTIIVAAGHSKNSDPAVAVWDDRGNTYTLAAEYRRPPGGTQPRILIYSCEVTTALQSGDSIYFEVDVGSSLLGTLETGCKGISAYLFSGTVDNAAESGNAHAITSSPSVAVGGGGLIVAALGVKGADTDTHTPDADWVMFDGAGEDSSASEAFQIRAGFRLADTGGETYSGTISQARDWVMVGATFDTDSTFVTGDGRVELVGTSASLKRCDDTEHYHTDRDPTAADDWDTGGWRTGTLWVNDSTGAAFLLIDRDTGDWLQLTAGAPTGADYLVGTAQAGLSGEIVVGTTPGGELGGTWASPTVDATHSGSTHSAATDAHIADASDAHDASAISVLDAGGNFVGTDVEAVLAELDAAIAAGGIPATIVDAKGDLIVATAADTVTRQAVGTDGHVLTADSSLANGIKWAAPSGTSPTFSTYTPALTATVTNPILGTGGSITGRYWISGKTIFLQIFVQFGSAGVNAGSGNYRFSLPPGVTISRRWHGDAFHFDSSATQYRRGMMLTNYVSTSLLAVILATGVNTEWAHNQPVAHAANDQIIITYVGEID